MINLRTYIIIPTHSDYIDVCMIFLKLLEKHWPAHPMVIISMIGENKKIDGYKTIYNDKITTLPQCIYKASKIFDADYYFCFLGDALISKNMDIELLEKLLEDMYKNEINYCSLLPVKSSLKHNKFNKICKYIKYSDRYSHNFVAYIASKSFINNEFSKDINDYDFETKYLKYANQGIKSSFKDRIILKKNLFNIYHGISKGKWIPSTLRKVNKNYEIDFTCREKMNIKEAMLLNIGLLSNFLLPNIFRKYIKELIAKIFNIEFATDY